MLDKKSPEERRQITTRIRGDLLLALKHLAADTGQTMNTIIEEGLEDLMQKYERGEGGEKAGVQRVYTLTREQITEIARTVVKEIRGGYKNTSMDKSSMDQVSGLGKRKVDMMNSSD